MENKIFALPMTTTFSLTEAEDGKFIAHSLDFDLVCVDTNRDVALAKLRFAVKRYIEVGIENGRESSLPFPAPDEYRLKVKGLPQVAGDPIMIEHPEHKQQEFWVSLRTPTANEHSTIN